MICLQWWQIVVVLISMVVSAAWGSNRAWNKGYFRGWQNGRWERLAMKHREEMHS